MTAHEPSDTPPHLLVIEDDPDITRVLQYDLEDAGFHVTTAGDGTTGLKLAKNHQPDVVLLDLDLPNLSGRSVLTRLRQNTDTPVIILTAFDDVQHKLSLFEAGANDYLTKPFHAGELLARIRIQLRRNQAEVLTVGQLSVNVTQRHVTYAGQDVHLSEREFELLTLLARQAGRVFTYAELAQAFGRSDAEAQNLLRTHVSNLRKKLEQAGGVLMIRNVRGIGYALRDHAVPTARTEGPAGEVTP